MSCVRRIDDHGILSTTMDGVINREDVSCVLSELPSYANNTNEIYEVVHYMDKAEIGLTSEDWSIIQQQSREILGTFTGGAIAFVSKRDLLFGLFRQHQALVESDAVEINVFRCRDKAYEWVKQVKLANRERDFLS